MWDWLAIASHNAWRRMRAYSHPFHHESPLIVSTWVFGRSCFYTRFSCLSGSFSNLKSKELVNVHGPYRVHLLGWMLIFFKVVVYSKAFSQERELKKKEHVLLCDWNMCSKCTCVNGRVYIILYRYITMFYRTDNIPHDILKYSPHLY